MSRRAAYVLLGLFILGYLSFLVYFLSLHPGGPSGNPAVIWAVTSFASGGMMMMAVYMATLYLFRGGEKAALYFTLFCAGECVRFLIMEGSMTLTGLIPAFPLNAALAIRCLFVALVVIGITSFVFEVFAEPKHKKRLPYLNTATAVGFSVAAVIAGVTGTDHLSILLALFLYFIFIDTYCIYIIIASGSLRKNRLHILYFASLLFYAAASVTVALFTDRIPHLALIASTVFVIAHIVLMSDRYNQAILSVEQTNENLERIVDDRTRELRSTIEAMKELVSNISHDLKTPLTIMILNLEKLAKQDREPNEDEHRQQIGSALQKSHDLQRITQNLFEVSRIESGQSLYEPQWIPLRVLLPKAQMKYGDFIEGEGLSFEIGSVGSDDGGNAEIYADPQKIWSVFDNIIYNAARHTAEGGLTVTAEAQEDTVDIIITDTGEGIAPEHLPHIFERFYKASIARSGGDNGVGLYIVKSVMEGCGGNVTARSEPGIGTSVILTFIRRKDRRDG